MRCPNCEADLHMTERQGVEIDYCPKCRGVWLDRGELDKIIERASEETAPARDEPRREYRGEPRRDYRDERRPYKPYKKKKSFLSEIFEFGD